MISKGSCLEVNRKDETEGGIVLAISAISSSGIGPGPLGISETNPTAEAPYLMASHASSTLAIQQILTLGFLTGFSIAPLLSDSIFQKLICIVKDLEVAFSAMYPLRSKTDL